MDREDGKGVPAVRLTEEIAAALGETEKGPRKTIVRVVELLGEERARTLLAETIQIEAAGGLQTTDGTQRHTAVERSSSWSRIKRLPASGRPSSANPARRPPPLTQSP